MNLPHVMQLALTSPWAITPDMLTTVAAIIARHSAGIDVPHLAAADRGPVNQPASQDAGVISVIPIGGVLVPKASPMTDASGMTSYDHLSAQVNAAIADPSVRGILLNVDSPGGSVAGLTEAADVIRQARDVKPVYAIANTLAASAAYWLAAQAEKVFATPSADVGSIGVFAMHQDMSKAFEDAGISPTLISAGRYKTEGHHAAGPLSQEAQARMQAVVDARYQTFLGDVAIGRMTTKADVAANYGEGRVLTADEALQAGMIDEIATYADVIGMMVTDISTRPAPSASRARQMVHAESDTFTIAGEIVTDDQQAAELRKIFAGSPIPSFDYLAGSALRAAVEVVTRAQSLADVRRGRLTNVKRETLADTLEGLRAAAASIEDVLAATDRPPADAITAELARAQMHLAAHHIER
jgi:signal peptide peptidase SppA